jgi:hypothetical protein
MEEYDLLDIKSETQILSVEEKARLDFILRDLNSFWVMEETKAKQRSREKWVAEGDRNTAYFHAVANQRRRKKMIQVLDGPDGPVHQNKEMLKIAIDYYKDLFCLEPRPEIRLKPDFFSDEEKVSIAKNEILGGVFSEEEVKEAVFGSYADGAPGPDGLSFIFYQTYWDIVKGDLIAMFNEWYNDNLDLYRLNFAMITLIPKENEARSMKKFRPISLLNCSFKIFTKVLTNRLARIINRLISYHQSAFIRGRYILESIVTAHEIIHEVHRKKEQGLVFKIDYEKAYDKVKLDFLFKVLQLRGFSPIFIRMIKHVTLGGSVGVKVNDEESDFFLTGEGLRQGDPIAPLLFNCVVDVFSRMLVKGTNCGLIRGLCPNFILGGVVSLQYADDTLLFLENDPQVALNLKWILSCFEQISGMRINFHKSELIPINIEPKELLPFIEIFQCKE